MTIKRILQNPLQGFKKELNKVKGVLFVKSYSAKIKKANSQEKASLNLEELFPDQRSTKHTNIEKIKHIAVKILLMIDCLSKEYDFNFMLAYGSLLGALRHDGFIPWDDDLDIMMTKADADKLIDVCQNFPSSISVFPMGNNFLKVMDNHSKISLDGKRGIAVDIFILDDAGSGYSFVNVHNQRKIKLERKDIFPIQQHQFEDQLFSIPNNSDKILTAIYGDYMVPPPPEKRVSSHMDESSIHIYDYPN